MPIKHKITASAGPEFKANQKTCLAPNQPACILASCIFSINLNLLNSQVRFHIDNTVVPPSWPALVLVMVEVVASFRLMALAEVASSLDVAQTLTVGVPSCVGLDAIAGVSRQSERKIINMVLLSLSIHRGRFKWLVICPINITDTHRHNSDRFNFKFHNLFHWNWHWLIGRYLCWWW